MSLPLRFAQLHRPPKLRSDCTTSINNTASQRPSVAVACRRCLSLQPRSRRAAPPSTPRRSSNTYSSSTLCFHIPSQIQAQAQFAPFSSTGAAFKKKREKRGFASTGSSNRSEDEESHQNSFGGGGGNSAGALIDPSDFSELDAKIKCQIDGLKERLHRSRGSGAGAASVSVEMIEALMVEVKIGDRTGRAGGGGKGREVKGSEKVKVRLRDLATVVPRGARMMVVLVNEEPDIKPILSALHSSPYSLNPQHNPTNPTNPTSPLNNLSNLNLTSSPTHKPNNPLQIHLPLPPPTTASRTQNQTTTTKPHLDRATAGIRDARAQWQKWYHSCKSKHSNSSNSSNSKQGAGDSTMPMITRLVGGRDGLEKAHAEMETRVEKGVDELGKVWKMGG